MPKINLVDEVLKHTDEEIIDYLYTIASGIYRHHNTVDDPVWLLTEYGELEQIYLVLKALKQRNDSRRSENSL